MPTIALRGHSKIVDALVDMPGMPKDISRIRIDLKAGQPIKITVEFWSGDNLDALLGTLTREFTLEEDPDSRPR